MVFAFGSVERIIALVAVDLIAARAAFDCFILFIADDDLDILQIVDTPDEAADILLGYYQRECQ